MPVEREKTLKQGSQVIAGENRKGESQTAQEAQGLFGFNRLYQQLITH